MYSDDYALPKPALSWWKVKKPSDSIRIVSDSLVNTITSPVLWEWGTLFRCEMMTLDHDIDLIYFIIRFRLACLGEFLRQVKRNDISGKLPE